MTQRGAYCAATARDRLLPLGLGLGTLAAAILAVELLIRAGAINRFIVPTANREKATLKVRVGLKEKDPRVLPDMAVKVTFAESADASAATRAAAAK